MVYDAKEHIILYQTQTAVLGETIEKHMDKYFEAGKAAEAQGNRMLHND